MQNGTVEMGHTASYYYVGKDPTFALFCAVPFGLNARQQNAWFYQGGGQKLIDEFGKPSSTSTACSCGNTGAQMGGWFRKEIKTVDDLKGLKMRIGGLAGKMLGKLGVVPQQIAGGDIYPALEKGTIDAAEWVGPYDDEKLGFYKVAPVLLLSRLVGRRHRRCTTSINLAKWNALPKSYQAIVTRPLRPQPTLDDQARYDAQNPQALKRLVASGAQLRPFPQAVMEACLQGVQRGVRRNLRQERGLQEGARFA